MIILKLVVIQIMANNVHGVDRVDTIGVNIETSEEDFKNNIKVNA